MPYLCTQVSRFIMLFQGRSGSTLLTTALDSHPAIRARGEILADIQDQGARAQLREARSSLRPPWIGPHAAVGFKTKLMDVLDPDGLAALLKQKRPKVILLLRRNRVKLVVSWINSERLYRSKAKWQSHGEGDRPAVPFQIDPADFHHRLQTLEGLRRDTEAFVNRLDLPTLSLRYEDLLVKREETFSRVFSFLDVEPKPVKAECIKTTSDDLRDVIENFDELRAHYSGTEYEPMFERVLMKE